MAIPEGSNCNTGSGGNNFWWKGDRVNNGSVFLNQSVMEHKTGTEKKFHCTRNSPCMTPISKLYRYPTIMRHHGHWVPLSDTTLWPRTIAHRSGGKKHRGAMCIALPSESQEWEPGNLDFSDSFALPYALLLRSSRVCLTQVTGLYPL